MRTLVQLSIALLVVTFVVGETFARNPGRSGGQGNSVGSFNHSTSGFGNTNNRTDIAERNSSFETSSNRYQSGRDNAPKTWPNGDTIRTSPEQRYQTIQQRINSRDEQAQRVRNVYGTTSNQPSGKVVERSAQNGTPYTQQSHNQQLQQYRSQFEGQQSTQAIPQSQYRHREENRYRTANSTNNKSQQTPSSDTQSSEISKNMTRQYEQRQAQAEHLRQLSEKNGNTNLTEAADRMQQQAQQQYEYRNQRVNGAASTAKGSPSSVAPTANRESQPNDLPAGPGMANKPSMFQRMRNFFAPK